MKDHLIRVSDAVWGEELKCRISRLGVSGRYARIADRRHAIPDSRCGHVIGWGVIMTLDMKLGLSWAGGV
ncbi:Efflux pump FUS6 [Fusarium oxysporum f. sp. albedinis]|nr:Efflux pump FUS6 [Fusarium oxysporum f. sp. albedinis]